MKGTISKVNALVKSMDGHFVIRDNSLFIYDQRDHLLLFIPSYILTTPAHSADDLRQGVREQLKQIA